MGADRIFRHTESSGRRSAYSEQQIESVESAETAALLVLGVWLYVLGSLC